jgi:3-methyladenine DNA glycosylase Mpg
LRPRREPFAGQRVVAQAPARWPPTPSARLGQDFFARDSLVVARDLLGRVIRTSTAAGTSTAEADVVVGPRIGVVGRPEDVALPWRWRERTAPARRSVR